MLELPVYVVIQNRILVNTFYILLVILVFFQFLAGVYNRKYLLFDSQINGYFTTILDNGKDPLDNSKDLIISSENQAYCLDQNNLDQDNLQQKSENQKQKCEMVDEMELLSSSQDGDAFITTRIIKVDQRRKCGSQEKRCNSHEIWWHEIEDIEKIYTIQPESFELKIEHSLGRSQIHGDRFIRSNQEMEGLLLYENNSVAQKWPKGHQRDIIPLQLLLETAGINSLDLQGDQGVILDTSLQNPKKNKLTFRDSGILIELAIHYSNANYFFDLNEIKYQYKVKRIPSRSVRKSIIMEQNSEKRTLVTKYGIQIKIVLTGQIGYFDFYSVLNNFVTPLGVTFNIITTLLIYLIYYNNKFQYEKKLILVQEQKSKQE